MLQVIHRMANNLWSNLNLPAVWGNYRVKTLWKGKGSKSDPSKYRGLSIGSTMCKLIINIFLERIRPWYEDNHPKNRADLEETALQQIEYIQWKEFTKYRIVKKNLYVCYLSNLQQHSTAYRGNGCSTRLDSTFLKVKAVPYLGKTLPKNINLPGGSSNILSNLRCTPRRPWKPMSVQFVYWLCYVCFNK